jgi:hypothetical protein
MESHAGARRHYTTTVEAAVVGMARPVVGAVIEVIVVVSFMMLPITTVPPIAKVLPITVLPTVKVIPIVVPIATVPPIAKVLPITVPPIAKVLPITVLPTVEVVPIVVPIAKVMKVSIKIMVAEEENRRKAHVKR